MIDKVSSVLEWCGLVGLVRGFNSADSSKTSDKLPATVLWVRTPYISNGGKQVDYESEGTKSHPLLTLTRHADGSCRFNAFNRDLNELAVLYTLVGYDVPIVCTDSKVYTDENRMRAHTTFMNARPNFFDLTRVFPETTGMVTRAYSLLSRYKI